jgi:hypothetical protein
MKCRSLLRLALGVALAGAFVGACGNTSEPEAARSGWTTVVDEPSGAQIDLPEAARPTSETAPDAGGSSVTLRNYATTAAGGAVEVGFNVLDTHGGRYDFDEGVEQVASSLDGEVVSTKETTVDGHDAVDVEVSYGQGNVVLFQLVNADDHVLQPLVAGPADSRELVEETYEHLTGSLDVEGS